MVRDLQMCNRLTGDLIAERDRLREELTALKTPQVLWEVRAMDGEVMDRFVAPVDWVPGERIQRFELAYDVRFHQMGEAPRLATDEAVHAYIKRVR